MSLPPLPFGFISVSRSPGVGLVAERENGTSAVQHTVIDGPTSTHGEIVVPIDPQEFTDAEDDLVSLPRSYDFDSCPLTTELLVLH
ncbi:hypothetical protein FH972_019333 [Carpinus fangiana]|uniref:Uncharacterized protein n=1 Tax=Carpinus fangiana TaxID=176857 RepID=A0A5N6RS09_9ROSI|nr:hypothetical protein FH972_019333 [Carpinus fangiana]